MTSYEKRDLRPRSVALSIAAFLALAIVAALVSVPILRAFAPGRAATSTAGVALRGEGEEVWVPDAVRQRRELHDREQHDLDSYEWISKEARVVRIPVERAIEILAERGLPAREGGK